MFGRPCFATPPAIREGISVETILERGFRFKEQGFYIVSVYGFERKSPDSVS